VAGLDFVGLAQDLNGGDELAVEIANLDPAFRFRLEGHDLGFGHGQEVGIGLRVLQLPDRRQPPFPGFRNLAETDISPEAPIAAASTAIRSSARTDKSRGNSSTRPSAM